jgi:O-methyltransferase
MDYRDYLYLLELLLLLAVFIFLLRFILFNYGGRIRKPASWVAAVKEGRVPEALKRLERKYPDRIRFYNFWLQAERLRREDIAGSMAEVGVYKGRTANVMHRCAPERPLHLFDTFEGFPASDLEEESGRAAGYTTRHFAGTSPGRVRALLGDPPGLTIHKGYFQDTAAAVEDERFALVSLDADLARPTRAALAFFYPRLAPGGVILIHDYNSDWPGLVAAVDNFCRDIPENPVPVPDADSTVMIIKSKA